VTIVIRIEPASSQEGVTVQRVCLRSGTLIGVIEHAEADAFKARNVEGHLLVTHEGTTMTFPSLSDAAAHIWMAFMARRADPAYTSTRSERAR
jgi:hypothetical protein